MADKTRTTEAKIIGKDDLNSLIKRCNSATNKLDDAKTDLSELISAAVEKKNLHKGAFGWVRRLKRMDPVKLYAWLQNFDAYREHLALDDLAGESLELDEGTKAAKAKAAGKRGSGKRKGDDDEVGNGEGDGSSVTDLDSRRGKNKEPANAA